MESSQDTDQYYYLIDELEKITQGTNILAERALFEGDFKNLMLHKFDVMIQELGKAKLVQDRSKIEELMPVIYEEKIAMQTVRDVYRKVIDSNNPERFETRVMESREYSHTLKVNYKITDFLNSIFLPLVSQFFIDQVLQGLLSQFDRLCIEMLAILSEPEIDYSSGILKIQEIAPGVKEDCIKRIFSEVNQLKDNRKNHAIFQKLSSYEKENVKENRQLEPDLKVDLIRRETIHADRSKIQANIKDSKRRTVIFKNQEAKAFYQMFFSDRKKIDVEAQDVWYYFCLYFQQRTGRTISEDQENKLKFMESLSENQEEWIKLKELDQFFQQFVKFEIDDISIDEFKISGQPKPQEQVVSNETEIAATTTVVNYTLKYRREFKPMKNYSVKVVVEDDFDENREDYIQLQKTVGIMKRGYKKNFQVATSTTVRFGKDTTCNHYIPLGEEIDPFCFNICNRNGVLFIQDVSDEKVQTKIQVNSTHQFRLNQGDYYDIGLAQIIHIRRATSKVGLKPSNDRFINIRYVPQSISSELQNYITGDFHLSDNPELEIEYETTDHQKKYHRFTPQDGKIMIGRDASANIRIEEKLRSVSKLHCYIEYNEELGWILTDPRSTCKTWAHLKTYNQSRNTSLNSYPVLMYQDMYVKVLTFLFRFTFEECQ
ncbi:UNKNOWN [Stylonychia lemnae]|uniref:FHA domain-containing protein n=1 Tax=Stylonychia lemnae TaxID=5949 RepID=A0A078AZT7_STYLE|nr:UNKNOWN [Stylonychia lemnae]|eukprot:CDW87739.1 UNKNOWN [Stylonychia lemnae]